MFMDGNVEGQAVYFGMDKSNVDDTTTSTKGKAKTGERK